MESAPSQFLRRKRSVIFLFLIFCLANLIDSTFKIYAEHSSPQLLPPFWAEPQSSFTHLYYWNSFLTAFLISIGISSNLFWKKSRRATHLKCESDHGTSLLIISLIWKVRYCIGQSDFTCSARVARFFPFPTSCLTLPSLFSGCTACFQIRDQNDSKHSPASRYLLLLIPQSGTLFPRYFHGLHLNLFQVFAQMSPYQWDIFGHPIQISIPNHTSAPPCLLSCFLFHRSTHFYHLIKHILLYVPSKSKDHVFFLITSFYGNYVTHNNSYILQQTLTEAL